MQMFNGIITADDLAAMVPWVDDGAAAQLGGWLWRTDAEHRFTYFSPSVTKLTGRAPEWHYGRTRQELGNLNLTDLSNVSWPAALARRERFGPMTFVRAQNGLIVIMHTIGVPVFDARGSFRGYRGFAFECSAGTVEGCNPRRTAGDPQQLLRLKPRGIATTDLLHCNRKMTATAEHGRIKKHVVTGIAAKGMAEHHEFPGWKAVRRIVLTAGSKSSAPAGTRNAT